jgi:hypothetical protein
MWPKCVTVDKKQGFAVSDPILILSPFCVPFLVGFSAVMACLPPPGSLVGSLEASLLSPGACPGAHGDTLGSHWGARGVTRCIWRHVFIDFVRVLRNFVGVLRPWWLPLGFIGIQVLRVPNGPQQRIGGRDCMKDFFKLHHLLIFRIDLIEDNA